MHITQPLTPSSRLLIPFAATPIPAGPTTWVSEDYCSLDVASLITGGRDGHFAFELTGDSALPHIRPGAIVFACTNTEPQFGEMVVAEVDGLVCLKKFEHSKKGLYLASSNGEKYPPRKITQNNTFRILGVYVGHLELKRMMR